MTHYCVNYESMKQSTFLMLIAFLNYVSEFGLYQLDARKFFAPRERGKYNAKICVCSNFPPDKLHVL